MKEKVELIDQIMDYEMGLLNDSDTLDLFAELIKSGMAWSLQGHFGRTASALIEDGWLNKQGEILKELY